MKESPTYLNLLDKLNAFTRKYYLNNFLRGALLWIGLVLLSYIAINVLEYEFWFETGVRKALFYGFLLIAAVTAGVWMGIPLLKYFNLSSRIDNKTAAKIIGNHFPEVQDKLLNILQLKEQSKSLEDSSLLIASIEQKTENIKLVNFPTAIDLKENRKYLKYALPPLAVLLLFIIAAPNVITDSTQRLLNNNTVYEKPAPFQFDLLLKDLEVLQFSDVDIDVEVDGEYLPNDAQILINGYSYGMRKTGPNAFSYQLKNIQSDRTIQFQSGSVVSRPYAIKVIGKPSIESFKIELSYPKYLGKRDEVIKNTGDIIVPVGTQLNWVFSTLNTDDLSYLSSEKSDSLLHAQKSPNIKGEFLSKTHALNHEELKFYVSGNNITNADSVSYNISTIPDNYPIINVEKFSDSTLNAPIFFVGKARDDYGISALQFRYYIIDAHGKKGDTHTRKIEISRGLEVDFEDVFNLQDINLKPGEQINFYYQVYDNDAVNGPKSSRSPIMSVAKPSIEEYEKMEEQNVEDITSNLMRAFQQNEQLKQEIEKLRNKLLSQQDVNWQDKKALEDLLKLQKEIQEKIEEARDKFKENKENQKEFNDPDEALQEKQDLLEELLDKMDQKSELEELLEKIQELMQELDKDKSLEMMDEMDKRQKEQDLDLDRLKELFKTLQLERDIQQQMEKIEELAEKEMDLSEEAKNTDSNDKEAQDALMEEHQKLMDEFEKVKDKMEEIAKDNKKLAKPKDIGDPEKDMHNIMDDMQQGQENLGDDNNSGASEKMKDAAKQMQQMSQKMQNSMASGGMEQMQEDLKTLRQLLENLVTISFDQEDLINDFKRIDNHTPLYVENVQGQFKLKEDFSMVEDSLRALGKRVFQLEPYIMEKVGEVNDNIKQSLDFLEERQTQFAANHQQRTMKAVNDLAVMLSETMEQMQMEMSQQMEGSQMCENPGMSNPSSDGDAPMDKISEGQKGLNEEMQKMAEENKEKMQSGEDGLSSEDFARMAKEQAQLRKMLEKYSESKREQGLGDKSLQDIIDQMEQLEKNLVNKRLTSEMLKRQEEIMTRLLEAQNADRQQKMDEKRKAETVKKEREKEIPPALAEYLQKRKNEIEVLKRTSPPLKPFYKALIDEYYQSLRN